MLKFRAILGPQVQWVVCSWHVDNAWKPHLRSENDLLNELFDLRLKILESTFWSRYNEIKQK